MRLLTSIHHNKKQQSLNVPLHLHKIGTVNTEVTQAMKDPITQQRLSEKVLTQATPHLLALQMSTKLISLLSRALSGVNKQIASAPSN